MRKTFTKLDGTSSSTTPEPTCKEARAAYKAFCNGALETDRLAVCKRIKRFAYGSPTCGKKCFNNAISTLESANIVIADPNSTEKQVKAAEAKKKNLPSLKILEEILTGNAASKLLIEEKNRLKAAVQKNKGCRLPKCAGASRRCPENVKKAQKKRNK
jgi:hypothetical protein